MSWVGILIGDDRKAYVAKDLLSAVENLDDAAIRRSRTGALLDAQIFRKHASPEHAGETLVQTCPWIKDTDAERVK